MDFYSNYLKQTLDEMRLRNLSPRTIKIYLYSLKEYFRFLGGDLSIDISLPNHEQIQKFLLSKKEKGGAQQTVNLYLNAVKFFYSAVIKTPEKINIHYAKRPGRLPEILSRGDISKLIHSVKNIKHKLLLAVAYGAGLRVSEAVNLRVKNIDLAQLTLEVRGGKGNKDRITVFPEKLRTEFSRFILG